MARKSYFELGFQYERAAKYAKMSNYEEHEPIYLYHLSVTPLHTENETQFFMEPKSIWAGEDDIFHIKRICTAPTVEQCLIAICPSNKLNQIYIYRTVSKVNKSVISYGVFDAPLTQERWITRKRKFMLVGEIPCGYNDQRCEAELLSRRWKEGTSYPNYICMNFDSRGGCDDFERQHRELLKTRKFMRKYDKNHFNNDIERKIHDNQRNMKLRLNRYEPKPIRASSSH